MGNFLWMSFMNGMSMMWEKFMYRSLITCLGNGSVILPQPVFINLLAGQSLVTEANGDVYACDHFVYPEYKVGNLTQQPLTEIVLSSKQQQFGLEKSQKLTALCRHCEFRKLCYGAARNIVLFLSKMNPIHIIIYVPLTVISLNKRHSICRPWLVKFGYIHPPLKVEWCFYFTF